MRIAACAGVALAVLALACERPSSRASATETSAPPPAPAQAVQKPSAPASSTSAPTPEPAATDFTLRAADGRVSLVGQSVDRRTALRELARAAKFDLEGEEALPTRVSQLELDDVEIESALSALLPDVAYQLDYEREAEESATRLSRVSIGRPKDPQQASESDESLSDTALSAELDRAMTTPPSRLPSQQAEYRRLHERVASMSPEEQQRLVDERREAGLQREDELLAELESPDPSERADAALDLPLGGDDPGDARLGRMIALLADDPDASVRETAARRLGEAESPASLAALIGALADSEPRVVLGAIEALEDIDDPAAIPHLEPLLADPDSVIREAAELAIEYLEP